MIVVVVVDVDGGRNRSPIRSDLGSGGANLLRIAEGVDNGGGGGLISDCSKIR